MFSEVSSEPVLPTQSLNSPSPYTLGYPESLNSKSLAEWTGVVKTSLGDENSASNVFSAHLREDQGPGSTEKKRDICLGAHFDWQSQ